MKLALLSVIAVLSFVLGAAAVHAAHPSDWAEGTASRSDGATRDYYNRAARLAWRNFNGDWRDSRDKLHGESAYAVAEVKDTDSVKLAGWDVTSLVRQWQCGQTRNQGFFLRSLGGGKTVFASREWGNASQRPRLIVRGEKGAVELAAAADTFLDTSTYRSHGTQDELFVSRNSRRLLVRFDLARLAEIGDVSHAELQLYSTRQYGDGSIGVFRCAQGQPLVKTQPAFGLAKKYPRDAGIANDPAVLFTCDFESKEWAKAWSQAQPEKRIDTLLADPKRKFAPLAGKALRSHMAQGENTALNMLFKFKKQGIAEPDEIYFRYYLRLADDWNQTAQGGKLPGISGTYGRAGWGGRKSNGKNGWSARGAFGQTIPTGNPLAGKHPIGSYCYHADMKGGYGNVWYWQIGYRGYLENNRWYCIEQYVKLNTPGKPDGVLRAWIDGRPAFDKTDIRFRLIDRLKVEQIWMNIYHGGRLPSPHDQHAYIDNVVVARKYIGPMP